MEKESILFTPGKIGPLTLRNRTIRAAAFESMCPGNAPSDMLYDYHKSVASGGIGMTTLAYAAVTQSGLSFERQLWMRPDIIPGLKRITDAIHKEGAAAYRDLNATLGNFYEQPKNDNAEMDELLERIASLESELESEKGRTSSMDEQVALMEKSYELAAKYMGGQNGGKPEQGQSLPPCRRERRTRRHP